MASVMITGPSVAPDSVGRMDHCITPSMVGCDKNVERGVDTAATQA
jgi:hypothetical protein